MSLLRWSAAALVAAFELCSTPVMAGNDPLCEGHKDCRPLTSHEIRYAKKVFGNQIDYGIVRVINKPSELLKRFGAGAQVGGSNIHYHDRDFASDDHTKETIDNRVIMGHELLHVWQNQHGLDTRLMGLALLFRYPMNYNAAYKYKTGKAFGQYNMEQQAKIVEHYLAQRELYDGMQVELKGLKPAKRRSVKADMAAMCGKIAERYEILSPVFPLSPHKCNRAPH